MEREDERIKKVEREKTEKMMGMNNEMKEEGKGKKGGRVMKRLE